MFTVESFSLPLLRLVVPPAAFSSVLWNLRVTYVFMVIRYMRYAYNLTLECIGNCIKAVPVILL